MSVKFLCGAVPGMRAATEREAEQFKRNTQSNFELLTICDAPGQQAAHIAKAPNAGYFDMERITQYQGAWFDQDLRGLSTGHPVSEAAHGRSPSDPFVNKTVELMQQFIPEHAEQLRNHATAFPKYATAMCADYFDKAFVNGQITPDDLAVATAYLGALDARDAVQPASSVHVLGMGDYKDMVEDIDREMFRELEEMLGDWNETLEFESQPASTYMN
ncbi:hypothetical protein [Geopseudomonas aromaticivorans]